MRSRIEETGGRVVALSSNFRSTAPLCDWINAAFGAARLLSRRPDAGAGRLRPAERRARARGPGPCVLRLDVPASGNRIEPVICEDAERIGRFIADAIASASAGPETS